MVTLPREAHRPLPNLGAADRVVAVALGGLLAALGLRRRGAAGLALALAGGAILLRGVQGRSAIFERFGLRRFAGARGRGNAVRGRGVHVEHAVLVRRPPEEVYRFWRRFENLPRFMSNLVEVRALGPRLYRWVAEGPLGTVEWDAVILEENPPRMISWRSVPGSPVRNAGSVHFLPAPSGTVVRVKLAYKPPAGPLGVVVARATGREPSLQVREDLRRLTRVLEGTEPTRS